MGATLIRHRLAVTSSTSSGRALPRNRHSCPGNKPACDRVLFCDPGTSCPALCRASTPCGCARAANTLLPICVDGRDKPGHDAERVIKHVLSHAKSVASFSPGSHAWRKEVGGGVRPSPVYGRGWLERQRRSDEGSTDGRSTMLRAAISSPRRSGASTPPPTRRRGPAAPWRSTAPRASAPDRRRRARDGDRPG